MSHRSGATYFVSGESGRLILPDLRLRGRPNVCRFKVVKVVKVFKVLNDAKDQKHKYQAAIENTKGGWESGISCEQKFHCNFAVFTY